MTLTAQDLLKRALSLPPIERANLVDQLLSSLDSPDETIDQQWREEIGKRIDAYRSGRAETVSAEHILAHYRSK